MKLYIYDHCPYCVKARMIFGLKRVAVDIVTLLNDDEATPISMIGVKMVPILEKTSGDYMPESMDIVRYIDALEDAHVLTQPSSPRIVAWVAETGAYLYKLAMPRWVQAPLEEFATPDARNYFIRKKEGMIGAFPALLAQSDDYIAQANAHLQALEALLPATVSSSYGEDDIHLFAVLRSLSIVKGIIYPPHVEAYRQHLAQVSNVPLHDAIAL